MEDKELFVKKKIKIIQNKYKIFNKEEYKESSE